jgi:hypothetical protein
MTEVGQGHLQPCMARLQFSFDLKSLKSLKPYFLPPICFSPLPFFLPTGWGIHQPEETCFTKAKYLHQISEVSLKKIKSTWTSFLFVSFFAHGMGFFSHGKDYCPGILEGWSIFSKREMVLKIMRNGPNFSVLHYFQFFPITGSNI